VLDVADDDGNQKHVNKRKDDHEQVLPIGLRIRD
jgi:hypothetical protein